MGGGLQAVHPVSPNVRAKFKLPNLKAGNSNKNTGKIVIR